MGSTKTRHLAIREKIMTNSQIARKSLNFGRICMKICPQTDFDLRISIFEVPKANFGKQTAKITKKNQKIKKLNGQ